MFTTVSCKPESVHFCGPQLALLAHFWALRGATAISTRASGRRAAQRPASQPVGWPAVRCPRRLVSAACMASARNSGRSDGRHAPVAPATLFATLSSFRLATWSAYERVSKLLGRFVGRAGRAKPADRQVGRERASCNINAHPMGSHISLRRAPRATKVRPDELSIESREWIAILAKFFAQLAPIEQVALAWLGGGGDWPNLARSSLSLRTVTRGDARAATHNATRRLALITRCAHWPAAVGALY